MTGTATTGPIPPLPAIAATPDLIATARANCAARLRSRGHAAAAEQVERDGLGWAVRHEVMKLQAEAAAREHA